MLHLDSSLVLERIIAESLSEHLRAGKPLDFAVPGQSRTLWKLTITVAALNPPPSCPRSASGDLKTAAGRYLWLRTREGIIPVGISPWV